MKCPGNLKDINAPLNYMQSACSGDLKDINVITSLYLKKCPGDRKDENVLRHYSHLKNVLEIART